MPSAWLEMVVCISKASVHVLKSIFLGASQACLLAGLPAVERAQGERRGEQVREEQGQRTRAAGAPAIHLRQHAVQVAHL